MSAAGSGNERLSINQATVPSWSTSALLEGAAEAGFGGVGLWRDRLEEMGTTRIAARAAELGIKISSLCRGGWFDAPDEAGRRARMLDNRHAVEEAAELGAQTLVLVPGPAATRDLEAGRAYIAEAITELKELAAAQSVTLGVEAMHPMYCGDRSAIVTLTQALGLGVGVVIDTYHLWWDPQLDQSLAASAGRIVSFQLADWIAPPPDPLNGRGMIGDGCIDLRRFSQLVDSADYKGLIETEIFHPDVWALDPRETLALISSRYKEHVA